jgi:hypothetical protein
MAFRGCLSLLEEVYDIVKIHRGTVIDPDSNLINFILGNTYTLAS